jgi:hypothetical protein
MWGRRRANVSSYYRWIVRGVGVNESPRQVCAWGVWLCMYVCVCVWERTGYVPK